MTQEKLDANTAAAALNQLYLETFVDKLASLHVYPESDGELQSLVAMARKLANVPLNEPQLKQASDRFAEANQLLDQHLGYPSNQEQVEHDVNVKFAEHPYWQNVALALASGEHADG